VSQLSNLEELFAGRHFDREVIILCVRWYLRYKLSFRDLVEMMAERGLNLAHTTILRWVRRYTPEFVKRWNRFGRTAGRAWRVDETISRCAATGPTSIERWTRLDRRSTSGSAGRAMQPQRRPSSRKRSDMRGDLHIRSPWTAMRLRIELSARCARTVYCRNEP
jgi:hypothetical protein